MKFCTSLFYAHINTAFCFYKNGPLQVVNYCGQPWHCIDAVQIRYAEIMKIVHPVVHYHTLWCLIDLGV